jgi:hypothetical protein
MSSIRRDRPRIGERLPAGLVVLLGVTLGALALEFLITHPDPPVWWRVELLVTAAVSVAIVASGYWLARSHYEGADLWIIFGWSVLGIVGAVVLAGGIYLNQTIEQVSIAEPAFLFEFLALIGAALGIAFGMSQQARLKRRVDAVFDTSEPVDSDAVWSLLRRLDGDGVDALQQRWTMLEHLINTDPQEIPLDAFAVQLSKETFSCFPRDTAEVERLLYEKHLPILQRNGLVVIDDEIRTVRYVGPESIGGYLSN